MRLKVGDGNYASYFPQERPLLGKRIRAWDESGKSLGEGLGIEIKNIGGGILAAGKRFDSNHVLHWVYIDEEASHDN